MGEYLPDGDDLKKVPKEWIANICASVLKNIFTDWVKKQVNKRNRELIVQKGLAIDMDPEIAEIF